MKNKLGIFVAVLAIFVSSITIACADNTAIVSFTFDDGSVTIFENAFPVLDKYDIPATLFLMTKYIGNDPWYVDWNQVAVLQKYGWEIGSHTHSHPHLTELSDEEIEWELEESIKLLSKHGIRPVSFASPYGDYNEGTLAIIGEKFLFHRSAWGGTEGFNSIGTPRNFLISGVEIQHTATVKEVKKKIDRAVREKKWLVFLLHAIKKGDIKEYQYDVAKLEQVVAYVASLVQEGKLKVKTIGEDR